MNQDFPNHQQLIGSHACGPTCLVNIFQHFGIESDIKTIFKEIHSTEKDYTHLPQLARYLLKKGLETKLISCNSYVIAPDWRTTSKEQLIAELKDWTTCHAQHDWLREALYLLYYLEDGGDLEITEPTSEIIDSYLDRDFVILALVEESWLWGKRKVKEKVEFDPVRGEAEGHFVVVYGKSDLDYKISDPYPTGLPGKEGLYLLPKKQLITSVFLRGFQVVAVKQKK